MNPNNNQPAANDQQEDIQLQERNSVEITDRSLRADEVFASRVNENGDTPALFVP